MTIPRSAGSAVVGTSFQTEPFHAHEAGGIEHKVIQPGGWGALAPTAIQKVAEAQEIAVAPSPEAPASDHGAAALVHPAPSQVYNVVGEPAMQKRVLVHEMKKTPQMSTTAADAGISDHERPFHSRNTEVVRWPE